MASGFSILAMIGMFASGLPDEGARCFDVRSCAHKGEGDVIDTVLNAEEQVVLVLPGEGRKGQAGAGEIDPLMAL